MRIPFDRVIHEAHLLLYRSHLIHHQSGRKTIQDPARSKSPTQNKHRETPLSPTPKSSKPTQGRYFVHRLIRPAFERKSIFVVMGGGGGANGDDPGEANNTNTSGQQESPPPAPALQVIVLVSDRNINIYSTLHIPIQVLLMLPSPSYPFLSIILNHLERHQPSFSCLAGKTPRQVECLCAFFVKSSSRSPICLDHRPFMLLFIFLCSMSQLGKQWDPVTPTTRKA